MSRISKERVRSLRVFRKVCTVPDKQVLISWNPLQYTIKEMCTAAFLYSIVNKKQHYTKNSRDVKIMFYTFLFSIILVSTIYNHALCSPY